MTDRKPLVRVGGKIKQLPAGDKLPFAALPVGQMESTVAAGDDPRIIYANTPNWQGVGANVNHFENGLFTVSDPLNGPTVDYAGDTEKIWFVRDTYEVARVQTAHWASAPAGVAAESKIYVRTKPHWSVAWTPWVKLLLDAPSDNKTYGRKDGEWAEVVSGGAQVTLTGNLTLYATQSTTLTITNYDSATTYTVSATGGTASITGNQITYTAGSSAGSYAVTVNGRAVPITVEAAFVVTPTVTSPANGATGLGQAPTFTTSAFATIGVADTFLNADHEIRTGPNGTGTLIASSYADTGSETSWTMPGSLLATATTYYYRKLHRGTALGASGWSEISFTTAASFGSLIGTQGGQGFGVGEYNGSLPAGFSAMPGASDKASANYGNYQYSDGSIMVFVPRFYYRIGHAASPRYATYGANAIDIVGVDTFATEAAANAAGYAMHRAFKDGGADKSGFFIDKYLASKTGTTSCKSIANADPISLTTNASYNPSNGMTGCTGILADAVVLARSRAAGVFNVASIFMYDALAKLALAHGQAATGTTHCAWYDASLTTNFPKGCNNGALADTNDGSVTYAVASVSPKPKTRATANFAKTTHNGQECGVADLNGSMYQAMLGVTMAGTSATDTTQNTTGHAYILKTSVALASLTGGYGGANDAWGSAANLAANYDLINGFLPWTSATGWICYGNGASQVFSGDTSGTDWLRSCAGVPLLAGTNATGTSQFGNDGCYQYGRANLFPVASGYWNDAALAGVFYRLWSHFRSYDNTRVGFRAAAYGS